MKRVKIFFLLIYFVLALPVMSLGSPNLFFSDITSGPKTGLGDGLGDGAIVTVWGRNIGSTQGSSKVYFKDSLNNIYEAAYVYYWTNADGQSGGGPADLYTYHRMQEIAFSIPFSAADGAGEIYVEVNGIQSNILPFTVRPGNIYHVKTTGDNNAGNGSWTNPWATVSQKTGGASTKVSAGDVIYVSDGVQEIDNSIGYNISGIRITSSGTQSAPISLIAYPGAKVLAQGTNIGISNEGGNYWNISKYTVKAGRLDPADTNPKSIGIRTFKYGRIVGNEITDNEVDDPQFGCAEGRQGALSGNALSRDIVSGVKMFGNYIHDWGCDATSKFEHTTYLSNRSGAGNNPINVEAWEFGWNYLTDNKAGPGLHGYDENMKSGATFCGDLTGTLRIHDNVVVNQRGAGIDVGTQYSSGGPSTCWSMPIEIYNNLLINNGIGPEGIGTTYATTYRAPMSAMHFYGYGFKSNIKVYNNTIYGYGNPAVSSGNITQRGAFSIGGGGTDLFNGTVEWVNNIVYDTKNFDFADLAGNESKVTVAGNNLWYNGGDGTPASPPSWDTAPVTSDPLFVDVINNNFRLNSNSPGVDAGVNLSSVVATDFAGTPRAQGASYDIGAYEYVQGGGDTEPPFLSNGSPSGTMASGTTSTDLSLTTDENVTCKYSTTSGMSYSSMTNTFTTTGGTSHSTMVSGLQDGQSYNYYVRCEDVAGNPNTSDYLISFSIAEPTANQPPDGVIDTPSGSVSIEVGQSVFFTSTSSDPDSNTPLNHLWNFGSGSGIANSTAEDPGSKIFNNVGTFTVTFTVTDSKGLSDPTPSTVQVTVDPRPISPPQWGVNPIIQLP